MATLAAQAFWLLPVLDVRLEAVIAGSPPPPSSHHVIYIAVEAAKALLLLMLALAGFHRLAVGRQSFLGSEPNTAVVGQR